MTPQVGRNNISNSVEKDTVNREITRGTVAIERNKE